MKKTSTFPSKNIRRIFSVLLLLALNACFSQSDQQPQALKLVEIDHNAIRSGNWGPLMEQYNDSFFQEHGRKEWLNTLQSMFNDAGKLKNIKKTFEQKNPRFSGDFYLYGYTLQFEHMIARETITVFKGNDDQKFSITGHIIKTRKF